VSGFSRCIVFPGRKMDDMIISAFFFQNVRDCSHVRDSWKVPLLLTDHLFLYCGLLASQDYPVTLLFVPDDTLKTEILISVKCYTYVVLNKSSNKIIYFY